MATPFIKFPGGKRDHAVISLLRDILRGGTYHTYAEVLVGGGAPFFALQQSGLCPLNVVLNDFDTELMGLYAAIRDDAPAVLARAILERDNVAAAPKTQQKREYIVTRERWNIGDRAPGMQLFLRWACWNALFRRNQSGEMNVPPCNKLARLPLPSLELLNECAAILRGQWLPPPGVGGGGVGGGGVGAALVPVGRDDDAAMAARRPIRAVRLRGGVEVQARRWGGRAEVSLLDWDFRELESGVFFGPGTLVYCDPPFDKAFSAYIASDFYKQDQLDLIDQCARWARNGATVIYSNHTTPLIEVALVERWRSAARFPVFAKRIIAADPLCRDPAPELIAADNLPPLGSWGR